MENSIAYNIKNRASFSEDFIDNDSILSRNRWPENRGYRTKSDYNHYVEYNGEKVSFSKREFLRERDSKIFSEERIRVPSAANFPTYNYRSSDQSYFDDIRRAAMSSLTSMNNPWHANSFTSNSISQDNVSQPSYYTGLDNLSILPSSTLSMKLDTFRNIPGENMYGGSRIEKYSLHGATSPLENMYFPQTTNVIQLTKGILFPPSPNAPPPTVRKKPLGCKTVFISGLTLKITEEIIREIFMRCGNIETVRMSKEFCYIRFCDESSVDKAICFSGYKLNIENKGEAPFTVHLHVDYSHSRDDEYDYERKQRALKRRARHEEQGYKKPSTRPIESYADHLVSCVCDKLKDEDTFMEAANTLIFWLEKGECTKKNAGYFFSMIQSAHTHVKKLEMDKKKYESELGEVKTLLKKHLEGIVRQLTEIEKVFKAAMLKKCWDQFTKAQRKNIETWKKEVEELKSTHLQEVIDLRDEEEMELSDEEDMKKTNSDDEQLRKQYQKEGEALKNQLDASQRVIKFLTAEHEKERKSKDDQIAIMQKAIDNLTSQLKTAESKVTSLQSNHEEELKRKNDQIASMEQALQNLRSQLEGAQSKISLLQSEHTETLKRKDDQIVSMQQNVQNSLRCQLEVAESKILLLQSGHEEELKNKDAQIVSMQQALQTLRKKEFDLIQEKSKIENELKELLLKVLLQ